MLHIIKKKCPNVYIIIVAITIGVWFQGINFIINAYVKPTVRNGILLSVISLLIFYMDDYSLSELYNYNPINKGDGKNNDNGKNKDNPKSKDYLIRHAPSIIY